MRSFALVAAGLVLGLAGFAIAQSTSAPAASQATATTGTVKISFTGKAATKSEKIVKGDTCTLTITDKADVYTAAIKDTTQTPALAVNKGTISDTTLVSTLNLKKLGKVSWTVSDNTSDVVTLTTTDTLVTK